MPLGKKLDINVRSMWNHTNLKNLMASRGDGIQASHGDLSKPKKNVVIHPEAHRLEAPEEVEVAGLYGPVPSTVVPEIPKPDPEPIVVSPTKPVTRDRDTTHVCYGASSEEEPRRKKKRHYVPPPEVINPDQSGEIQVSMDVPVVRSARAVNIRHPPAFVRAKRCG